MSSEHAIERVPLSEIREGDMLQDPKSGNWIKVTRTADRTMSVTHDYSDEDGTVIEPYRVYYGDGGEEIASRFISGLVNRQVRSDLPVLCRNIIRTSRAAHASGHATPLAKPKSTRELSSSGRRRCGYRRR
jgi:hypothetical protein